jgi:hypothetical protein
MSGSVIHIREKGIGGGCKHITKEKQSDTRIRWAASETKGGKEGGRLEHTRENKDEVAEEHKLT